MAFRLGQRTAVSVLVKASRRGSQEQVDRDRGCYAERRRSDRQRRSPVTNEEVASYPGVPAYRAVEAEIPDWGCIRGDAASREGA